MNEYEVKLSKNKEMKSWIWYILDKRDSKKEKKSLYKDFKILTESLSTLSWLAGILKKG